MRYQNMQKAVCSSIQTVQTIFGVIKFVEVEHVENLRRLCEGIDMTQESVLLYVQLMCSWYMEERFDCTGIILWNTSPK